ncbi:hypothetical protein Hanom_Chr16g01479191 [Helianthus anomalus]
MRVFVFFLITCQATPQPKPCHTPRTRHSPVRGLQLHVSTHAPNPRPAIPHGLRSNTLTYNQTHLRLITN